MSTRRTFVKHAFAIALSLTAVAWFGLDHFDGAAAGGKSGEAGPAAVAALPHHAARRPSPTATTVTRHPSTTTTRARRAVPTPEAVTDHGPGMRRKVPAPVPPVTMAASAPVPPAAAPVPPAASAVVPAAAPLPLPTSGVLPTPAPPPDPYAPEPVVQIATMRIPKIGLVAPLYEGVSLTVINNGPGHWPGTALPGAWGNTVVAGHRTTYTQPFLNIDLLAPGDPIIFDLPDGTEATYATTGTEVVDENALWIVNQSPGGSVTLFSCHPKGSAAQRLVVHGTLVSLRKH